MAELYSDSKTFVDKKLRMDPAIVISNFNLLMNQTGNQPTKQELQLFVDQYFDAEGKISSVNVCKCYISLIN